MNYTHLNVEKAGRSLEHIRGEYTVGEKVYPSAEGLRYQKTGRLTNEDAAEA